MYVERKVTVEWAKIGKHVFESSEHPIGSLERKALIQNIAVFKKYHGLRTCGFSEKALADPDRLDKTLSPQISELDRLADEMIAEEEEITANGRKYNNWPAPDSMFWVQWGERFGDYLVVVTNCEGEVKVHTLHISGEPVYWERYKNKSKMWYVQNLGYGNGAKDRVKETKCDKDGFVAVMRRRCGDKIVGHLDKEIFNFGEI